MSDALAARVHALIAPIREYWNRPPAPYRCSACKCEIAAPVPANTPMASMAWFPNASPPCPHCGSSEGFTITITTGGADYRSAKDDINALLTALEAALAAALAPKDDKFHVEPLTAFELNFIASVFTDCASERDRDSVDGDPDAASDAALLQAVGIKAAKLANRLPAAALAPNSEKE